jgi:Ser/Thr protein kinase RdoA (MazF antagonist)
MDGEDFFELTPAGRARRVRRAAMAALEAYDLPVARVRLITNETNGIFRIDGTDGGRFVLRVGRGGPIGHTPTEVRSETEWLGALARETDLRIPAPVSNRDGEAVTRVEVRGVPHARDCVLFDRLPGRQLDDDLRPETMSAYGALAARLHEHAAAFRPSPEFGVVHYDRVFLFDQPVVLFDPARTSFVTDAQRDVFHAGAEVVTRAIESLRAGEPARVLHGDLHRWNVLVDRRPGGAGPALAAIDFEDLCWGWPVQDLAIALYYLHEEPTYPEILAAFRDGYESVRPWPDTTGDGIATFIAGRAIVMANDVELLEDPEIRAEAPELMARFERRVRRLLER